MQENKLRFVKQNHLPVDFPKISSNDDKSKWAKNNYKTEQGWTDN